MPISGLIITTDHEQPHGGDELRQALAGHPAVTLGPSEGHRHAVVVETVAPEQDKQVFDWIRDRPGVVSVDVVFVDFDSDASSPAGQDPPQTQPIDSARYF